MQIVSWLQLGSGLESGQGEVVLQAESHLLGEEESRGREDSTAHPDGGDDTHGNTPGQLTRQGPHYDLTQDEHQAQYMLTRRGSLFF